MVHRFRPLETLRRPLNRNDLSGRRLETLASLFAKSAQRRRTDLRPGHFPQHHGRRFLSIRSAQTSDAEWREHSSPEQFGILRAERSTFLLERFFHRYRSFQRRDRLQADRLGAALSRRLQSQLHRRGGEERRQSESAKRDDSRKGILFAAGGVRRNSSARFVEQLRFHFRARRHSTVRERFSRFHFQRHESRGAHFRQL